MEFCENTGINQFKIYIYVVHTFCLRQGSHMNLHVVDSRNIERIKWTKSPNYHHKGKRERNRNKEKNIKTKYAFA